MATLLNFVLLAACLAMATAASVRSNSSISVKPQAITTYHNPIMDFDTPDPQVLFHNGFYYLVFSEQNKITIYKSAILTDFRAAQNKVVYRTSGNKTGLWAPEMHYLQGELYIYFAMDENFDNNYHRMYYIKARDPKNPLGAWSEPHRLFTQDRIDYWAIDGTVMEYQDGNMYMIWSGWPAENVGAPQNLYIAKMCNPMQICSERVLLREPKFDWEGPFTLEGPFVLQRNGRTFLVFSADSTWGPDYCLGIMGIDDGADPMDPNNWWHNNEGCVFYRNDEENVFCTGHAAFTTSPDGLETWMLFHATNHVDNPGSLRVARVEKIGWDENDHPVFPRPSGDSRALAVPSGQVQETFGNPIIDELSADPAVILLGGFYYLTQSTNAEHEITIIKSEYLTDFRQGDRAVVFRAPENYQDVWASELHMINGELYLYFTMTEMGKSHRMYVQKADDPKNPLGTWQQYIRLIPEHEEFAIDGTVLQYGNGKLYYIYSDVGHLFISEMIDPVTVKDKGVLLRSPKSDWECGVNEGPFIVENEGRTFLVFSACSTWNPNYCLTMIGIDDLKDPMVPGNWWDDLDRCLFSKDEEANVYTTGHATFTTSPDGTELWLMYHGTNDPNSDDKSTRIARVQRMMWNQDKSPRFPRPSGNGVQVAVPSGQKSQLFV